MVLFGESTMQNVLEPLHLKTKNDLLHSKTKTTTNSDFYFANLLTDIEYESLIHHYLFLSTSRVQATNCQMEK